MREEQCSGHKQLMADVREIRNDVKKLIEFKGRILGIISAASVIVTFAVNMISKLL